MGFPLCGRARVACGHNRARGVTELLAASRQELPGDLQRRCPQKPQRTLSHAHSRMTGGRFLTGTLGGKGAQPPKPKRWRCGGRGERARARGLLQRHRSSSRASGEEFGQVCRASEDLGVSKGGRPAPHFVPGIRKGVKLPCACLCLLSAGQKVGARRGPSASKG